jgi:DNA-directed RNA polymerase specialized sigma24 family protein
LHVDPQVRSKAYGQTFVRYLRRLYAYLRATYSYCMSEEETADVCGSTFLGFIEKVEKRGFYATGNLFPLLVGIAENQFKQLIFERIRRKECGSGFLETLAEKKLRPEELLVLRETIREAVVEQGILPAFERLVFTAWHDLVTKNGGFVPTHEELRDSIFGPTTKAVFGTLLADEDDEYLETLTESVKRALHRAFEKLRDYLKRRG